MHVVVVLLYVLRELGYTLICQVIEKRKCSFENTLGGNSESSTRSKKRLSHQSIV